MWFPHLPRWIRKTSGLIENPFEVRDLFSRLTHEEVWYILDFAFFIFYQSFAHYAFWADLCSLVAGEDELIHQDGDGLAPDVEEDLIAWSY